MTKYVCLKCNKFAYKKSLECYIPEKYPCLKECKKAALFLKCYKQEHKSEEKQKEHTDFEKKRSKNRWLRSFDSMRIEKIS